MRFVRCQDLGYCNCNYLARANTDSEAIAKVMLHVKKEHPHVLKQMNLQKILEFKQKIRKNVIFQ